MPDVFTYCPYFFKTKKNEKRKRLFINLAAFFFTILFITVYAKSSAQCGTHVVINTTTSLHSSSKTIPAGTFVTLTAIIENTPGPYGYVIYYDNGVAIGTVNLNAGGYTTLTAALTLAGNHNITGYYSGGFVQKGTCGNNNANWGYTYAASITAAPLAIIANSPLPLTLVNFTVSKQNSNVLLTWQTLTEENTTSFSIERSTNGDTYMQIGMVTAAGNSSATLNYSFTDNNPAPGNNYYRLQMIDNDGSGRFSPVRVMNVDGAAAILVYPNPAKNNITITGLEAGMQLRMISVDGRILTTKVTTSNTENINVQNLAIGIYMIQAVKDGTVMNSIKFSKN